MLENLRTPDGMVIVASTRQPDPSKLPDPDLRCSVVRQSFRKRQYICGHRAGRRFKVSVYGTKSKLIKQTERCPECFIAHTKLNTISCALCGLTIFPGEAVTVYAADQSMIRSDATIVEDRAALGCLRLECCPSGGFIGGHWTEAGFKPADWP